MPVVGLPEVVVADDIATLVVDAFGAANLADGDVLVVTQKIVSKAEGRLVPETTRAAAIAAESARILRRTGGGMVIAETHHGFVCANAGIDASNVAEGHIALLPVDPDASARRIRARLEHLTGKTLGVIVSDTFGRAWRLGQTDVAIGVAGIEAFVDHRGRHDRQGRELNATRIAIADEIAGAAEMVMGKIDDIAAAVVRGAPVKPGRGAAIDLVRQPSDDLFR
jgi:coenzyme F420-0:L-glutamate ligase/coenzyme F420-1:gamma-L-glutamate ligase